MGGSWRKVCASSAIAIVFSRISAMASLCIDIGTTVVKTVAFAGDGSEIGLWRQAAAPRPKAALHSEQDMAALWRALAGTLRAAAESLDEPVEAIAITGQGDGLWLVDAQGLPVGPAMLWNDGRAGEIVAGWNAAGLAARGFDLFGGRSFAGAPHALLAWLAAHDPARLAAAHAALSCGGYIFGRMTGCVAMDRSDASLPFLRLDGTVAEEVFALFGIEDARRLLPEILPDTERAAALLPQAAEAFGLPAGIPVVLAPYDIACMAIGMGAVAHGQASAILGTTICAQVMLDAPDLSRRDIGINIAVFGKTLRAFPTLGGCETIDWMAALLGLDAPGFAALAAAAPPGANGLVLLPYMSPAGERAPFFDQAAHGALLGLKYPHTRADLARATLEAVAFVVRDCLEAAGTWPGELRLCGGGARSDILCRIIADVTGIAVLRSADNEVGARGALIAARAVLHGPDLKVAADGLVRLGACFTPDEAFGRFLALRAQQRASWRLGAP
jgi:xylulokinase